jgi:hypothetical protein
LRISFWGTGAGQLEEFAQSLAANALSGRKKSAGTAKVPAHQFAS